MLKVAIVGCGKIADAHASQIRRIAGCEIVGVCDKEPLMARQLYERFPIRRYFSEVADLLREARPDVIHITTPPESHYDLARLCLEHGCHVYVEKPFTLYASEAATRITHKAMQVFGAWGVKKGSLVEQMYREARITEIWDGTSEIQRLIISRNIFGRA